MVVSSSSGMCVQPMEPDVSINNMMLGLTSADRTLAKGVLEMSAWAACAVGAKPLTSKLIQTKALKRT